MWCIVLLRFVHICSLNNGEITIGAVVGGVLAVILNVHGGGSHAEEGCEGKVVYCLRPLSCLLHHPVYRPIEIESAV